MTSDDNCAPDDETTTKNGVALAAALRPLLIEHAARCERERQIPDEVLKALRESGLFNLAKPMRCGGPGAPLMTLIEVAAELGKGCVGTAWSFNILCATTGAAAALPPWISKAIFTTGEELVCGVLTPSGKAVQVEGGYRVSGSWTFASGCMHADWALCGVQVLDAEATVIDSGMVPMPIGPEGVSIRDSWNVAGVCGSGSHTLLANDVFVPQECAALKSQAPTEAQLLGIPELEPRDRWPFSAVLPLAIIGPLLGAAEAILDTVVSNAGRRGLTYWLYPTQSASEVVLEQIGEAATVIGAAWQLVRRSAHDVDSLAQTRVLTFQERARIQADCGYAAHLLRSAAETLMNIAGASAFANDNALQRLWRDLNVGSRHTFLNTRPSMELLGRALTGREPNNQFY